MIKELKDKNSTLLNPPDLSSMNEKPKKQIYKHEVFYKNNYKKGYIINGFKLDKSFFANNKPNDNK